MASLVGQPAPDFNATAVQGDQTLENFTLSQFRGQKYTVLFFYPLDFTFVCPTELIQLQQKLDEFEALNTQVIGISTDSWFSHLAWLRTPHNEGGIQGVTYPIVSDFNKTISTDYGVLLPGGMALRGAFIMDREGIVQVEIINNLPLGRNVDEILRLIRAIQFCEEHGEVCPANWNEGQPGLKPTSEGIAEYLGSQAA